MTRRSPLFLPLGAVLGASLLAWAAIGDEDGGSADAPPSPATPTDTDHDDDDDDGEKGAATDPKDTAGPAPTARPAFTVIPRIPVLEEAGVYPCSDCHDATMPANPTVREMVDDHDTLKLEHGGKRFWCLTCHGAEDRDQLIGLNGQKIGFDEAHLLCAQCHFRVERDFAHGAHGKRLNSWRGERVLAPCAKCHDAHSPSVKPRKPLPPDRLREGLQKRGWSDRPHLPHKGSSEVLKTGGVTAGSPQGRTP